MAKPDEPAPDSIPEHTQVDIKGEPTCNMPGCNQPWLHDGPCTSKIMTSGDFISDE